MARVRLINPAAVEPSAIADICDASSLPPGDISLIVGEPALPESYQAVTLSKGVDRNEFAIDSLDKHDWDCAVIIGAKWGSLQPEFPAYFAYLLGHEFGHASTALTNLTLTAYETLIVRDMGRVAPSKSWRWDEMPHEAMYDAFGIAVAEELFGRERVEAEFAMIIARGLPADVQRLRNVLRLSPSMDLLGLRAALAAFTLPLKDELLALWHEDQKRGGRIVSGMRRLEALWEIDPGNL